MTSSYKFEKREDLDTAVSLWINNETSAAETYGDINSWDVSAITDFSKLFYDYKRSENLNISSWDVSNGTDFSSMFKNANHFNGDISGWDVSNGTDFEEMFHTAFSFNQDISGWDVSNGTDFSSMFENATWFNQDISGWDVSKGTDFSYMFRSTNKFNKDIGNWVVSNGNNFSYMFYDAVSFDQDLSDWDVSNGNNFSYMFYDAVSFDQDLSDWSIKAKNSLTGADTDLTSMFEGASEMILNLVALGLTINSSYMPYIFNSPYSYFSYKFVSKSELVKAVNEYERNAGSAKDRYGNINKWDVSKIEDFSNLFSEYKVTNPDISNWDVSNGKNFSGMFENAIYFNEDISNWDVSNGNDFESMFYSAKAFNRDITEWQVKNTAKLDKMFDGAELMQGDFIDGTPNSTYFNQKRLSIDPIIGQTFNLDVDGNGTVSALGDGLMIIRKLFRGAFDNEKLTFMAISDEATRTTKEIHDFIQGAIDDKTLDVDGDGNVTALGDGLMIVRRLWGQYGWMGHDITDKAISNNATRTTDEIYEYIDAMTTLHTIA